MGSRRRASVPWFWLAVLLLAVATMLAWRGLGERVGVASAAVPPPGSIERAARVTYREPLASGGLLSLEAARQSARLFSGQDELVLDGALEQGPFGASSFAIYYLKAASGELAGEASYRIDARSGEVLEASRLDLLQRPEGTLRLSSVQAEERAEQFVAERFLGFQTMSLVERGVAPSFHGAHLYSFKWAMVATESGAELPTSVSVSLSADSGEVVWYLGQRDSTSVDARPTISRDTALVTAAMLVERSGRWDARSPSSVRLQIIYNRDNRQQLVWAITFPSKTDAETSNRPSLRMLIDAHTGEVASNAT